MKTEISNNENKKTVSVNNLQGLSDYMDQFHQEEENKAKPAYGEYRNATNAIVSQVAYLIGVDKEQFTEKNIPFKLETYAQSEAVKEYRIIRNLCRLRNAFERSYMAIVRAFTQDIKNIGSVPELIPVDAVESLGKDGINIYKSRPDIDQYIIAVNLEINNRIQAASKAFPEWVKWAYIKPLFLMKDGAKLQGIKAAGLQFNADRNRYPYQCWINWDAISFTDAAKGNILYNDEKFLTLLYERNQDRFENLSLVRDIGNVTMRNLTSLLDRCSRCVIVVDCENSDAVKMAAAFSSLPAEQLQKIQKILLFDSEYTTTQWKTLVDKNLRSAIRQDSPLPLEHITVPRLNQSKSQVDMTLAVRTSREVYTNGVDAVLLASSDSDYWAMIRQLENVRFLVMLERIKTGNAILDTLTQHEIPFCFIDDFCTGASYRIKTDALLDGIRDRIDGVLSGKVQEPLNVRRFMEETLAGSWIRMTDKEKEAFFARYLQKMKMTVDGDGNVKIQLGE